MTANDLLAGYVALQRLLSRRSALKRELDTPPQALATLRTQFSERHEKLGLARAQRETLETEQGVVQRDAEQLREEREHFRKQKSHVTNMKQLSAVVSELDHVETQLKAKEDRLLEILQGIEAADAAITMLGEESPAEKALREQAEAAWAERRQGGAAELATLEREVRAVQERLGEGPVARFRKLWASRKPNAVVPMDGTACSACHGDLRPSLVQQVRAAEELQYCDHCRRLLYDPEQFPPPA